MNLMNLPAANARYMRLVPHSFKGAGEIFFAIALLSFVAVAVWYIDSAVGLWNVMTFVWIGQVLLLGIPLLALVLLGWFDRR